MVLARSVVVARTVAQRREDGDETVARCCNLWWFCSFRRGDGGGCHGGWKERRKLGLGFWEMEMMTWQPSIGQLVSARIVATWLALVG